MKRNWNFHCIDIEWNQWSTCQANADICLSKCFQILINKLLNSYDLHASVWIKPKNPPCYFCLTHNSLLKITCLPVESTLTCFILWFKLVWFSLHNCGLKRINHRYQIGAVAGEAINSISVSCLSGCGPIWRFTPVLLILF